MPEEDQDPVLRGFDGLDYPGRRKPLNRDRQPPPPDPIIWDAHPIKYVVNGSEREFFLIGAVAAALGYSVQSVRAWEAAGLLPPSPFRSPRTRRPVAGGRSTRGKRLWTREQIEGILRLAKRHKVILNRQPPTHAFALDVNKLFNQIADDISHH